MYYIEDILHYYIDTINVNDKDTPILRSISTQVKKGTALTDRQYELVRAKLLDKQSLLRDHNINVEEEPLTRLPIREIDRSKYITIVSHTEMVGPNSVYESYKDKWMWIKVRFPFSKKDIVNVENILKDIEKTHYYHVKGSHEHYFMLTAKNAYHVLLRFENRNFDIDEDIVELYKKVKSIVEQKEKYISYTENGKLFNVSEFVENHINNASIDRNRELICADRSIMFGYNKNFINNNTLTDMIAGRNSIDIYVSKDEYSYTNIAESINKLNRFPVVVLIDNDNNSLSQLTSWHSAFSQYVDNSLQSVLFREEGNSSVAELNDFVKENNLNNWVDKNTKIIYIKKNKLPKLLINGDFKPITAIADTSIRLNNIVESYIKFNCDLVLFNDQIRNLFNKWSYRG